MEPPGPDALLTRDEVAKLLRMQPGTLRRLVDAGEFPRAIQTSPGVLVWTAADVAAHLYRIANRHRFRVAKKPKSAGKPPPERKP